MQVRTLHRFYTNDKLLKMGIKMSDICVFCKSSPDTMDHILLDCQFYWYYVGYGGRMDNEFGLHRL